MSFELECAIWHSTMRAEAIQAALGLNPRLGWSVGDPDHNSGSVHDRTYCRFTLGTYSQEHISTGLEIFEQLMPLADSLAFKEAPGIISIYFKNIDDAAELHLNVQILEVLTRLRASLVFR